MENAGRVIFESLGANQTRVDVLIRYNPPAGVLGDVGENLVVGGRFDKALQQDLDNFARMVDQAPAGALDPTSSNYLFHSGSAAAKGTTTSRQNETMDESSSTSYAGTGSTMERPVLDQDIISGDYDRQTTQGSLSDRNTGY